MVSKARNVAGKDIMMAPCRGYLIAARCQNRHRYNYYHFNSVTFSSLLLSFVKLKSLP